MVNSMRHSTVLRLCLGTPFLSPCAGYGRHSAAFFYPLSVNKRSLCLLTALCLLLSGCDSGSAASAVGVETQATNQSTNLSIKNDAAIVTSEHSADSSRLQRHALNDADAEDKVVEANGQSLMSAAKTAVGSSLQRTPMISEPRPDSALQAILIGDYKGMLPCESCDGINMTLNLLADGSAIKTNIYENPVIPTASLIESGVYRQDDNTIIVVYDNKNIEMYRIENNHLIMLDEHKKPNPDYTLSRK